MFNRLHVILKLASALLLTSNGTDAFAFDCAKDVQVYLQVVRVMQVEPLKIGVVPSASEKTVAITISLAEDASFLKNQFHLKLVKLAELERTTCVKLAENIYRKITKFATQRLSQLLDEKQLDQAYLEASNWLAPNANPLQKNEAIHDALKVHEPSYLTLVHERLKQRLLKSPWQYYREITVTIEAWNEKWSELMNREAPAAIDHESQTVALRPWDFTLLELEIYLFHELAHRAYPLTNSSTSLEREMYAWKETFDFIEYLRQKKVEIPLWFQSKLEEAEVMGLDEWVAGVVERAQHLIKTP